jgi:hypothetical protein
MFNKTKIALCVAIVLGGAGSAALASNENDPSDRGGFVVNGSMDGVNPAYHSDLFGKSAKAFDFVAPPSQAGRSHKKPMQR